MPSLRITGGALRGRRVAVPASDVRPTSERARQAYFNIAGQRIAEARFLDLFAGSGIFSLEALSRGAAAAGAVEKSSKQCAAIEETARDFGVLVTPIPGDVIESLPRTGSIPFDLVYADPPYDYDRYDDLISAIARVPLADDALVAVEHRRRTEPFRQPHLRQIRRAEYGEVWITFFQR
jgi:16S rRNA (guanine(966)-N(2))-methyltransferase RsmD